MIRTNVLLVPSIPIRLLPDLVDLEPLGSGAVELVASRRVTCTHIGHKRTSIMRPL